MLVNTPAGPVPIGTLVKREATRAVGTLNRVNATRVINLSANLVPGVPSAEVQKQVTEALGKLDLGPGVFFPPQGRG